MKSKSLPVGLVLAALLALSAGLSAAQGPAPQGPAGPQAVVGTTFTYQGELRKDGSPLTATCAMTFTLYDDPVAGSPVSLGLNLPVTVDNGLFTVALDFGPNSFTGDARWLQVAVLCPGDAGAITLSPRQALTAAPYALSLRPGAEVSGDLPGQDVLQVNNTATSGTSYGLHGRSESPSGAGVVGWNTATTDTSYGVRGVTVSTGGRGVYGLATAASGVTYGVYGEANSAAGTGVEGTGPHYGVRGVASGSSGYAYGVIGQADSTQGFGVYGLATAASGETYGVWGQSASTDGIGVHGYASAASGLTRGVVGVADARGGVGVYGYATDVSGGDTRGVVGQSDSSRGSGVWGHATASYGVTIGVYGQSDSSVGIAVYGRANATSGDSCGVLGVTDSSDGYGVYSQGNFAATGSKAAIVQTVGYGWRHLYSMESPDVLFEDVGTAQLVEGRAVVAIDPIFAQTVNLERPYYVFLTPQGGYCALYVAEKNPTSFTVRAQEGQSCAIAFDYRIVAKRLGYEDVRLAPAGDPALVDQAMQSAVSP